MDNENDYDGRPDYFSKFKYARWIRIRPDSNMFGKFLASPINSKDELEGMIDDGLFDDCDILVKVDDIKDVHVIEKTKKYTTLLDVEELENKDINKITDNKILRLPIKLD